MCDLHESEQKCIHVRSQAQKLKRFHAQLRTAQLKPAECVWNAGRMYI